MLFHDISAASRWRLGLVRPVRHNSAAGSAPWRTATVLSERIQAVRGLIMVLLVAFHAIATDADTAANTAGLPAMMFITHLFDYIRMPVFGFVAGFVYALKPISRNTRKEFATRKVMRLLVPCAIATALTCILQLAGQAHVPASWRLHEAWRIYLYPTYQFWFVQALLVDFALIAALEAAGALRTIRRFMVVVAIAITALVWLPAPPTTFFSIPQSEYLLPFFLLGLGMNRFRAELLTSTVASASLALLFGGLVIQCTSIALDPAYRLDRGSLLSVAVGCSASLCAICWVPRIKLLRLLGGFSFAIYLYHLAFIGVVAHLCKLAAFRSAVPLAIALIGAGILGVQGSRVLRSAMLGMR
ncbi:MAG TPA: acyltransferase [Steroidobacteraceae bacterium]|jgi:peptidoglycan/LPS O-acetylase OafA/YrhL|nr:acyltransferase [Steroidobacteraceae bacterium]